MDALDRRGVDQIPVAMTEELERISKSLKAFAKRSRSRRRTSASKIFKNRFESENEDRGQNKILEPRASILGPQK